MQIQEYIEKTISKCIRVNKDDKGDLIGLPYPYSVPCASDMFQEMYYWDTYFTNKGLILVGEIEQARNNVDNMIYLLERFGFVLNGNRTYYLRNSQPPFLSMMVADIYAETKDKVWLERAYRALCTEHHFWMAKRRTDIALNRYDCMNLTDDTVLDGERMICERLGFRPDMSSEDLARGMFSSGESGWDMNPRMRHLTYEYAPIDLNSLLFALEENLSYFAKELGCSSEAEEWKARSEMRAELCRKYMRDKESVFYDYHVVSEKIERIVSVACFYPLYCGMADKEEAEAARKLLPRLETEYGILTCEQNDTSGMFQWDYPNGWAPMQWIVAGGLLRYGYREDAFRIAGKFVRMIENCYESTGHLWEKYNVVDGSIDAANEYDMPPMMGWTFGVYESFCDMLTLKTSELLFGR